MGSGANIIIGVPLIFYLALMTLLCVKVGQKTSWKVGWLMAAGGIFLPLAMFIVFLVS